MNVMLTFSLCSNNPVDPTKETDSSFTFPTYQVTVTDPSTPIWVYCKQTVAKSHCAAGMFSSFFHPMWETQLIVFV